METTSFLLLVRDICLLFLQSTYCHGACTRQIEVQLERWAIEQRPVQMLMIPASRHGSEVEDLPRPAALRIKLKLNARTTRTQPLSRPTPPTSTSARRPAARAAATKSKSKTKKVAEEGSEEDELMLGDEDDIGLGDDDLIEDIDAEGEEDEVRGAGLKNGVSGGNGMGDDGEGEEDDEIGSDGESRRSLSPSKMTARQRGRGDMDLQETLLALPMGDLVFLLSFAFLLFVMGLTSDWYRPRLVSVVSTTRGSEP